MCIMVARQTNRLFGHSEQMITTQQALRASFWQSHPELTRQTNKEQNKHPANTHAAWCDYVKNMHRIGEISETLAQKAIL
jgi:hypothetical protein